MSPLNKWKKSRIKDENKAAKIQNRLRISGVYFATMSKAFRRETDDTPDPVIKSSPSVLPPGARNYITARGMKNLRGEFLELSAQPPSSQIRQRLGDLQNSLRSAEVIEPPPSP